MRSRVLLAVVVAGSAMMSNACSDAVIPLPAGGGLEVVADGLEAPVFLTSAPGDASRLFIVEKPGRIRVLRDGSVLPEPFLDLTSITSDNGERGLLSIAFDPQYASNGLLYVNHTDLNGATRIVRFTASSPERADPASAEIVLIVDQPFSNHNGGQIAFGTDGLLYIGMGDGGSGGDPQGNGQDRSTLLGSLLRIDVTSLPYQVPASNPFVDEPGVAPETYAYGLRNPWRFSFDGQTGDLWIGDVGQGEIEEVSFAPAGNGGQNFGWSTAEGSQCFSDPGCDTSGLVPPVHEYTHEEGCSITGGYVYRGTQVPSFRGRYFFADFCEGWIRSFHVDATGDVFDHTGDLGTVQSISSFGEDLAGELYVMSLAGSVYRIAAAN